MQKKKGVYMGTDGHWFEDGLSVLPSSLFETGYVIEMEPGHYFAGRKAGRIRCMQLDKARYFATLKSAEHYVYGKLGFIGMQVHICRVCWTLVEAESLEEKWRFLTGEDKKPVKFAQYQDAINYQRKQSLQMSSMVELYVFQEKELLLAA